MLLLWTKWPARHMMLQSSRNANQHWAGSLTNADVSCRLCSVQSLFPTGVDSHKAALVSLQAQDSAGLSACPPKDVQMTNVAAPAFAIHYLFHKRLCWSVSLSAHWSAGAPADLT